MSFKMTNKKSVIKDYEDWELLQRELTEYSDSINYSWRKFSYTSRVWYDVHERLFDEETIKIGINFKSEHVRKNPQKWGDGFRKDCIMEAVQAADDILEPKRTRLLIVLEEDREEFEEQLYERQKPDGQVKK